MTRGNITNRKLLEVNRRVYTESFGLHSNKFTWFITLQVFFLNHRGVIKEAIIHNTLYIEDVGVEEPANRLLERTQVVRNTTVSKAIANRVGLIDDNWMLLVVRAIVLKPNQLTIISHSNKELVRSLIIISIWKRESNLIRDKFNRTFINLHPATSTINSRHSRSLPAQGVTLCPQISQRAPIQRTHRAIFQRIKIGIGGIFLERKFPHKVSPVNKLTLFRNIQQRDSWVWKEHKGVDIFHSVPLINHS